MPLKKNPEVDLHFVNSVFRNANTAFWDNRANAAWSTPHVVFQNLMGTVQIRLQITGPCFVSIKWYGTKMLRKRKLRGMKLPPWVGGGGWGRSHLPGRWVELGQACFSLVERLIYEFYYLVKVIVRMWKWLQISSSPQFVCVLHLKYLMCQQVHLLFSSNFWVGRAIGGDHHGCCLVLHFSIKNPVSGNPRFGNVNLGREFVHYSTLPNGEFWMDYFELFVKCFCPQDLTFSFF